MARASSLLVALPYELCLDILILWVAADDKDLSVLDVAHTARTERPAFLSLLSMTTVPHTQPHYRSDDPSVEAMVSRTARPAQFAWMLSRKIKL